MENGKYYKVQPDKFEWLLDELDKKGYRWRENIYGSPIERWKKYSLNLKLPDPVLEIEHYYQHKFIQLTSELLIKNNNEIGIIKDNREIYSWQELLEFVGINEFPTKNN